MPTKHSINRYTSQIFLIPAIAISLILLISNRILPALIVFSIALFIVLKTPNKNQLNIVSESKPDSIVLPYVLNDTTLDFLEDFCKKNTMQINNRSTIGTVSIDKESIIFWYGHKTIEEALKVPSNLIQEIMVQNIRHGAQRLPAVFLITRNKTILPIVTHFEDNENIEDLATKICQTIGLPLDRVFI